jgi:hypothetical protein
MGWGLIDDQKIIKLEIKIMSKLSEFTLINHRKNNLEEQIKVVILTVLVTVIPVGVIFISLKLYNNTSLDFLTRDPAMLTNSPPYIGLFSNIGMLLWSACTGICLFTYAIVRPIKRYWEISNFLLWSGGFTAFLMLDDIFLLHEDVFPFIGIPEKLVYVFYVLFSLFFAIKIRKFVKKTEFIILFAAVGCLAASLICDALFGEHVIAKLEDVFKIAGISLWLTYFTRLCLREISSMVSLSSINDNL